MKRLPAICVLCLAPLAAGAEEKPAVPPMCEKTLLPGKERAAAAAATVRPALESDLSAVGLKFGDPVFIRIFKDERLLELFMQNKATGKFELFRTYPVAAASGKPGPKLEEGDWQVPEGFYFVPPDAMNPNSQFHLSFNIGYPNAFDRALGRTGSAIMVHGNSVSIGCAAMTDEKIEEIYTLCDAAHHGGQAFFRVHIFPFRMIQEKMRETSGGPWEEFWKNLREGYDLFEKTRVPPEVSVADGRYQFRERQPTVDGKVSPMP